MIINKSTLLMLTLFSIFSFGVKISAIENVVIEKINLNGAYASPWKTECKLTLSQIDISNYFGVLAGVPKVITSEKKPIEIINGNNLNNTNQAIAPNNLYQLIAIAAREPLSNQVNNLCDGATSKIVVYGRSDTDSDTASPSSQGILLYSTGSCGNPKQVRSGRATNVLRGIIDTFCPKTY